LLLESGIDVVDNSYLQDLEFFTTRREEERERERVVPLFF